MLLRSGSRAKALGRMLPISSPSKLMRPEVWSRSRITIIEVVDLPQPDSPTRPTLSPWPTVKLMPSTARNCSASTGGLRPNNLPSVAVAPWRAHQLLGIGVFRFGEDVSGQRGFDHAALLHHHHAVAIGRSQAQIVGDQDGRHAPAF